MPTDLEGDRNAVERYLMEEFRAINAHMPRRRKSLAELLNEEEPKIACGDGSEHFFRKKELALLAGMLEEEEREELLLPILIEVSSEGGGYTVPSPRGIEAKLLSKVLDMEMSWSMNKVVIFRPHLFLLRRVLKTCTQYVFTP